MYVPLLYVLVDTYLHRTRHGRVGAATTAPQSPPPRPARSAAAARASRRGAGTRGDARGYDDLWGRA